MTIKSDLAEAIEHNSTVVLTCSAKGSFLKYTWTNGTTPIVDDGKRLVVKEVSLLPFLKISRRERCEMMM